MKLLFAPLLTITATLTLSACSVFGENGVEEAQYITLKEETPFEVRHYSELVLVTTPMNDAEGRGRAFSRLFNYISGNNDKQQKIEMTAPVFMKQGEQKSRTMSFVMPTTMNIEETPPPNHPLVSVEKISNYTVAVVRFSGRLNEESIQAHKAKLETWMKAESLEPLGTAKAAGYDAPFTIPALRRNEVLIPIQAIDKQMLSHRNQ